MLYQAKKIPQTDKTITLIESYYKKSLELEENYILRINFTQFLYLAKKYSKAVYHLKNLIKLNPDDLESRNLLSWILVTAEDLNARNYPLALKHAKITVEKAKKSLKTTTFLSKQNNKQLSAYLDTLAEAYYQNKYYKMAVTTQLEALKTANDPKDKEELDINLQKYIKAYNDYNKSKEN